MQDSEDEEEEEEEDEEETTDTESTAIPTGRGLRSEAMTCASADTMVDISCARW